MRDTLAFYKARDNLDPALQGSLAESKHLIGSLTYNLSCPWSTRRDKCEEVALRIREAVESDLEVIREESRFPDYHENAVVFWKEHPTLTLLTTDR